MKIIVKPLFALLSLGLIAAVPLLRAQDAAASAAAGDAAAPDTSPPPPPHGKKGGRGNPGAMYVNQLKEKLNLTDDQAAKISAIMKDSMTKGMALRRDATLSDDDKRSQGQALRKAAHDQIRATLTPDQQTTFDAMPPPRPPRGKRKQPDADAPPPPPPADAPANNAG